MKCSQSLYLSDSTFCNCSLWISYFKYVSYNLFFYWYSLAILNIIKFKRKCNITSLKSPAIQHVSYKYANTVVNRKHMPLPAVPLAHLQAKSQTEIASLIHTRNSSLYRSLESSLKTRYEKLPTASPLVQFMMVVRPTQRSTAALPPRTGSSRRNCARFFPRTAPRTRSTEG